MRKFRIAFRFQNLPFSSYVGKNVPYFRVNGRPMFTPWINSIFLTIYPWFTLTFLFSSSEWNSLSNQSQFDQTSYQLSEPKNTRNWIKFSLLQRQKQSSFKPIAYLAFDTVDMNWADMINKLKIASFNLTGGTVSVTFWLNWEKISIQFPKPARINTN